MDPFETLMKAVDPLLGKSAEILHLTHNFMGFTLVLKLVKTKQNKTKQKSKNPSEQTQTLSRKENKVCRNKWLVWVSLASM